MALMDLEKRRTSLGNHEYDETDRINSVESTPKSDCLFVTLKMLNTELSLGDSLSIFIQIMPVPIK